MREESIYRIGGWAAAGAVVLVLVNGIFLMFNPIPDTVLGHFQQIEQNKVVGLVNLDLAMLISEALLVAVYIALYTAMRRASRALASVGIGVALSGVLLYFAVNPTFSFLYLSDQYATASTAPQRASLLSAGEALWANYQGTGFGIAYLMAALATLLFSVAMLRSRVFNRATGIFGLVFGAAMLIPPLPALGTVGVVASYISLLPMIGFEVLIAWRLLHLARPAERPAFRPTTAMHPAGSG
jgi:hypothetical protein